MAPALKSKLTFVTATIATLIIVVLAIDRLRQTPYAIDLSAVFGGVAAALPATGLAAIKVWGFWAVTTAIGACVLKRIDPDLGLLDAALGGTCTAWTVAYVAGQALGPIGLFSATTIWILMAAAALWLWLRPPALTPSLPSTGQKLALLAFLLLAIGLVPLELGSPVVPYMDVLSYPASVQRILTFGVYLPFDNDPYGCWWPSAQTPALELFYTMIALGSHSKLAVLAESASIMPMAALVIFATYRLGATVGGDTAGGMAALLLFFTNTFRRMVGMRGTAVDFALVAAGLAFFFDRRRSKTLTALGALFLGTAVASHPIDGGLGMTVAAGAATLWLAEGDLRRFLAGAFCLMGAALVAAPELAIGLPWPLPYPAMSIAQVAGITVIVAAGRNLRGLRSSSAPRWVNTALVTALLAAIIWKLAATQSSLFEQLYRQFPVLVALGVCGLLAIALIRDADLYAPSASIVVIALVLAVAAESLARPLTQVGSGAQWVSEVAELGYKLDEYWCPYFLALAAAVPFALSYRYGSKPIATFVLLAMLIYPWRQRADANYDYEQHSIAENWGIDLGIATRGYWSGTPDSRWTMGPAELALVDFLRAEVAAGRITTATHILHVAHDVIVWRDFNRFSVFTGINDDPIVYEIPPSDIGWLAGGRVRRISELARALASSPPYILVQVTPSPWGVDPPQDYDEVFARYSLRLFRRSDLAVRR